MNRHYDTAFYRDLVARIRTKFDNPSITTDIMVGFPGETEDEAMQTVDLVEKTQFDALFTFIFSPRPGTPAAKMDDPVCARKSRSGLKSSSTRRTPSARKSTRPTSAGR